MNIPSLGLQKTEDTIIDIQHSVQATINGFQKLGHTDTAVNFGKICVPRKNVIKLR